MNLIALVAGILLLALAGAGGIAIRRLSSLDGGEAGLGILIGLVAVPVFAFFVGGLTLVSVAL